MLVSVWLPWRCKLDSVLILVLAIICKALQLPFMLLISLPTWQWQQHQNCFLLSCFEPSSQYCPFLSNIIIARTSLIFPLPSLTDWLTYSLTVTLTIAVRYIWILVSASLCLLSQIDCPSCLRTGCTEVISHLPQVHAHDHCILYRSGHSHTSSDRHGNWIHHCHFVWVLTSHSG